MNIETYIRDIHNFPKQGIIFKDITPLMAHPEAMQKTVQSLLNLVGENKIHKVVGIESRGFFFATLLAQHLQAGFVPVRKKGKLPFDTISETYDLEYGKDSIEIHKDAIKPGENVLLHDDVLATGGTAKAACSLIERLGGNIIQCNFLIELTFLNGREKLENYPVKSLLSY